MIPKNEVLLYEDDKVYLVQTKDSKSHKVRVMAVTKRHTSEPTFQEQTAITTTLYKYMSNLMHDKAWFIVSGEHATIPQHFHQIACDFPLEAEKDPLFAQTTKICFTPKPKKILIGIPAKNEEKTISKIILTCHKFGDVVVVDDGSTDNTQQITRESGARLIIHPSNLGYGKSITNIFKYAKELNYDVLITLDSDGQHDPAEIPKFLAAIQNSDIIIGNRFLGKNNTPSYRKFGIEIINELTGDFKDSQCGFRAYNKQAINTITNNVFEKGMGVSLEILKFAQKSGLRIAEIPCTVTYDKKEKHAQNPLSHGFSLIAAFAWWMLWEKPSKTLLPLGLIFLLGTAIAGIQTLSLYAQFHTVVQSWALLTGTLLLGTFMIFNTLVFVLVFKNRKVNEK